MRIFIKPFSNSIVTEFDNQIITNSVNTKKSLKDFLCAKNCLTIFERIGKGDTFIKSTPFPIR